MRSERLLGRICTQSSGISWRSHSDPAVDRSAQPEVISLKGYHDHSDLQWPIVVSRIASMRRSCPAMSCPLMNLHTLEVTNSSFKQETIASILRLPSIRHLRILSICTNGNVMKYQSAQRWSELLPEGSNLVRLHFARCHIGSDFLSPLLQTINNLEEFEYYHECWMHYSLKVSSIRKELCSVAGSIQRYTCHSLSSIALTGNFDFSGGHVTHRRFGFGSFPGSFQGFTVLKNIHVHVSLLMDSSQEALASHESLKRLLTEEEIENSERSEDGERRVNNWSHMWYLDASKEFQIGHRLVNFLPLSAESLNIEMPIDENILQETLRQLPELKKERLPNLKEISYDAYRGRITRAVEVCERIGITLREISILNGTAQQLNALRNSENTYPEDVESASCSDDLSEVAAEDARVRNPRNTPWDIHNPNS